MTAKRCNIAFDCEKMKYPNTGIFYFCLNLGAALQHEIDPIRERLFFYTPKNNPAPFGPNALYRGQRFWHKFYNSASRQMDLWQCNYQLTNYLPLERKTKMVLTIHDFNFLVDTQKEEPQKVKQYLKKAQATIDRADHVVCISEYTLKTVAQNIGLNRKKIEVIHNGSHVKEFPGFDRPKYKPNKPFLFSIGIFFPKKNFHVLPALLTNNDYELILAGDRKPEYESVILEHAALHHVADRVKITGPISEEDKYWYYKNCAAFVFPSVAEGFGLPVVEAMFFGKPVFLSPSTSLPEIGGDLAFYFNSFEPDSMRAVFEHGMNKVDRQHEDLLKQRARQFTWQKAAQSYLRIYRELD